MKIVEQSHAGDGVPPRVMGNVEYRIENAAGGMKEFLVLSS